MKLLDSHDSHHSVKLSCVCKKVVLVFDLSFHLFDQKLGQKIDFKIANEGSGEKNPRKRPREFFSRFPGDLPFFCNFLTWRVKEDIMSGTLMGRQLRGEQAAEEEEEEELEEEMEAPAELPRSPRSRSPPRRRSAGASPVESPEVFYVQKKKKSPSPVRKAAPAATGKAIPVKMGRQEWVVPNNGSRTRAIQVLRKDLQGENPTFAKGGPAYRALKRYSSLEKAEADAARVREAGSAKNSAKKAAAKSDLAKADRPHYVNTDPNRVKGQKVVLHKPANSKGPFKNQRAAEEWAFTHNTAGEEVAAGEGIIKKRPVQKARGEKTGQAVMLKAGKNGQDVWTSVLNAQGELNPKLQILEDNGVDWSSKYEVRDWDDLKEESAKRSEETRARKNGPPKLTESVAFYAAAAKAAKLGKGVTQAERDRKVNEIVRSDLKEGTKKSRLNLISLSGSGNRGANTAGVRSICFKDVGADGKESGQARAIKLTDGTWTKNALTDANRYRDAKGLKRLNADSDEAEIVKALKGGLKMGLYVQTFGRTANAPCASHDDAEIL